MFEKFTERARKVMSLARQEAQKAGGSYIGPEHILLGIMEEGGGVACKVLTGVDSNRVRQEIERLVPPSHDQSPLLGQLPFSPRAKRVLELGQEEAARLKHDSIGTEHLLLGILKEGESAAVAALINLGVNIIGVRSKVDEIYAQEKVDGARYISVAHQVVFSTVPEATIDAMVVSSSEPIFSYELLSTKYVMALNAQKNGLIPMALNLWKLHVGGASKKVDWNGLYAIGSTVESAIVLREEDLEALWALASRHENEGEKAGE